MMRLFKISCIFLCFVITFSLIYLPAWQIEYAHHDGYRFLEGIAGQYPVHSLAPINIPIGRFMAVILATGLGWLVHSIHDLSLIRFISILELGLCASVCMICWRRFFANTLQTILCCIAVFTLPPFQSMVACAGLSFHLTAAVLASCAAAISYRKPPGSPFWHYRTLLAAAVLFLAIATHQAIAMFYWAVAAGCLISSAMESFKKMKEDAWNFLVAGLGAMGMYAVFLQIVKSRYAQQTLGIYNPYVLSHDYLDKLKWFVQEPLVNALNLWNIFPVTGLAAAVGAVIVLTCAASVIQNVRNSRQPGTVIRRSFLICFFFLSLTILSVLPLLVAVGNAPWYRCLAGLTAIIVIALIWSAKEWLKLLPRLKQSLTLTLLLVVLSLYGAISANQTVLRYRAIPSHIEMTYVKTMLRRAGLGNYNRIHLIRPVSPLMKSRYDEFGIVTSDILAAGVAPMMIGIIRDLARENGLDTVQIASDDDGGRIHFFFFRGKKQLPFCAFSVKLTSTAAGEAFAADHSTVIIDMTKLKYD